MKLSVVIQVAVCLFSAVAILAYSSYPEYFVRLCDEDGLIENLTSIAFLMAGLVFLFHARKSHFRVDITAGLGLLCIVAAGEEISWGQRLLGIQTPESVRAVNVQHELNFHNMQWIHGHYRFVVLVILIAFCLLLPPLTRHVDVIRRHAEKWRLPLFPLEGVLAMLLAIAYMAIPRLLQVENFRDLDEVGEFLVALGFLCYAVWPRTPRIASHQIQTQEP